MLQLIKRITRRVAYLARGRRLSGSEQNQIKLIAVRAWLVNQPKDQVVEQCVQDFGLRNYEAEQLINSVWRENRTEVYRAEVACKSIVRAKSRNYSAQQTRAEVAKELGVSIGTAALLVEDYSCVVESLDFAGSDSLQ